MLWAPEALHDFAARAPGLHALFKMTEEMLPATCALLGQKRMEWLRTLPLVRRLGPLALVHASPGDLWRAPLPDASDLELATTFNSLASPVAVYGHIHRPYVRELGAITVANTGSVSLSYDGDARASYLILDDAKASIRRVEYDIEREAGC